MQRPSASQSEHVDVNSEQRQTLRDRGICVVIPTSGNAGTIADVVHRVLEQCLDVIVVSDGCKDTTLDILRGIDGITIVAYEKNAGKGAALRRGFRKALEMGFAYAITIDADGQHFPEDIPVMLEANKKYPGALIVGQRMGLEKAERSAGSKFANAFSNFWFAVQTGHRLRDTQTGFRLYPLKKLPLQFSIFNHHFSLILPRYEAELELLVFASWHGIRLVSAPVHVCYPKPEERVSYFRPVRDFSRIFILNTVLCILAVLYGLPLTLFRGLRTVLRTVYALLFFFIVFAFVVTPFLILCPIVVRDAERRCQCIHRMLYLLAKFVVLQHGIPGVRFSSGNPHGEDFSKPAVIVCNHQSYLDLMIMMMLTPKLIVLTKDWVWNSPLLGNVVRSAEFYPVSWGVKELLPKLRELVKKGYSVAVYPEGTRSADCSVLRFHSGAFYLARELGVDILPLVLYGAGKALPRDGWYLRKWPVRLEVDGRLSPDDMLAHGETMREQAFWLRRYYMRRYAEIANRMEQM